MPSFTEFMGNAIERLLFHSAVVAESEKLTGHFREIVLAGDSLKNGAWVPGQKVQFHTGKPASADIHADDLGRFGRDSKVSLLPAWQWGRGPSGQRGSSRATSATFSVRAIRSTSLTAKGRYSFSATKPRLRQPRRFASPGQIKAGSISLKYRRSSNRKKCCGVSTSPTPGSFSDCRTEPIWAKLEVSWQMQRRGSDCRSGYSRERRSRSRCSENSCAPVGHSLTGQRLGPTGPRVRAVSTEYGACYRIPT